MSTPLYSALVEHKKKNRASFHTPGHKNKGLPKDLIQLDFTELPDTDSLFEAQGAILEAEKEAQKIFGSRRTLFSAGGCTLCIQTMMRLALPKGGKIICGRIIHRSAINTMALLGLSPVWVMPKPNSGPCLPGRICAPDIKSALENNPDAKAVYITSPDYYGVISDVAAISEICHNFNVPLLVDNAHGTHLALLNPNTHPIFQGADLSACSAHKTLPVLTGGAFLNIADSPISRKLKFAENAKDAMALFASTSPSYPIMASLDVAQNWAQNNGKKEFSALAERMKEIKLYAEKLGFLQPIGLTDPTRLAINTLCFGITGTQAAEIFRKNGVEPEYADGAYVVFIATPFNEQDDFERLIKAIYEVREQGKFCPKFDTQNAFLPPLPQKVLEPREAVLAPFEEVCTEKSIGRIAVAAQCPCPPGVPVVMPGEKITAEVADFLSKYRFFSVKVIK